MNKSELRQSYVDAGWEVQPVANWILVSQVGSKVKYDVNAASPDNSFGTAQVVVIDDGGAGETAVAAGFWADSPVGFGAAVRDYARGLEGGTVFAVEVTNVNEADEVATAKAYSDIGAVSEYVVKRRAGTFSFKLLA